MLCYCRFAFGSQDFRQTVFRARENEWAEEGGRQRERERKRKRDRKTDRQTEGDRRRLKLKKKCEAKNNKNRYNR